MNREKIREITEASPVEYYLSANDNCVVEWPYRMQPVHEATQRYAENADKYIVDSSFNHPDITNIDVLDKGYELDAHAIVLEDVYKDHEATVEQVYRGLQLAKEHRFSGKVICPLQYPYDLCWDKIGRPDMVAIGGMKDKYAGEKVTAAKELREHVGDSVWIHGLGWGATDTLISAIRREPELLDSIDASTPYSTTDTWSGTHRSVTAALRSLSELVESSRRMNPDMTQEPAKSSLEEWE